MQVRVQKWGESLALRIPKSIASDMGITAESAVELQMRNGKLEVAAMAQSSLELDRLLALVTEENVHGEIDSGRPVGREEL
ncbi:MAG: AbrB/MazE/SpoVT family DNA-binding domain-containing protein [Candidatus Hydrogenedentales bacterium]